MSSRALSVFCLLLSFLLGGLASAYCKSQCEGRGGVGQPHISDIISKEMFEKMLLHRNDGRCYSMMYFYKYEDFVEAAETFPGFGTTGNETTRKREIAAFFAQTAYATNEGYGRPDSQHAWGYCYVAQPSHNHPYYPRGPIQLSGRENYQRFGNYSGLDVVNHPELLEFDSVISFKSAIWFWMTENGPMQPSCHDVMIGAWQPTGNDLSENRLPGYGVTTNIINGAKECGHGPDSHVANRIGHYLHFAEIIDFPDVGNNLDCYYQTPFDVLPLSLKM